jgi:LPXTG-motif cell wall-anchored protein
VNMIITGVILFILGIVTLIASIIFIILDRRKEKRRPSLTR